MISKILPLTLTKLKILSALYRKDELNLAGISKEINIPSSNIKKTIPLLESILNIKRLGKIKLYSIRKDQINYLEPIIERYRLEENLGINYLIVEKINKIPSVEEIYLFGSYVKGEATKNSDIDIIIVTKMKEEVKKELINIKKITPIPIETIYMTPSQLKLTLTKIDTKLFHVLTDKNQRIKLY